MWTDAERDELRRSGVVRLPGAVGPEATRAMRERLWSEIERLHGVRPDAPDTWRGQRLSGFQRISRSDAFAGADCAAVREAAADVLGPCTVQPSVNPLVTLPGGPLPPDVPRSGWHLDLPASGRGRVPGLRVFTFLDAVEPGGGGTAVVAGSHRVVAALAASGPDERIPSRRVRETLRRREPWIRALFEADEAPDDRVRRFAREGDEIGGVAVRVVELTGETGDVLLMDLRALHAATPNRTRRPRLVLGQVIFPSGSPAPGRSGDQPR